VPLLSPRAGLAQNFPNRVLGGLGDSSANLHKHGDEGQRSQGLGGYASQPFTSTIGAEMDDTAGSLTRRPSTSYRRTGRAFKSTQMPRIFDSRMQLRSPKTLQQGARPLGPSPAARDQRRNGRSGASKEASYFAFPGSESAGSQQAPDLPLSPLKDRIWGSKPGGISNNSTKRGYGGPSAPSSTTAVTARYR